MGLCGIFNISTDVNKTPMSHEWGDICSGAQSNGKKVIAIDYISGGYCTAFPGTRINQAHMQQ